MYNIESTSKQRWFNVEAHNVDFSRILLDILMLAFGRFDIDIEKRTPNNVVSMLNDNVEFGLYLDQK